MRLWVGPDGRLHRPEVAAPDAFRHDALWQPVRPGTPRHLVEANARARASARRVACALEALWTDPDTVPNVQASLDYDGNPVVIIAPVPVAAALRLASLLARNGCAA